MAVVPANAREARFRVDAGSALQFFGARALDDHVAGADARDHDAPDGVAVGGAVLELAGQKREPRRSSGRLASARRSSGGGRGVFDRVQRAAQVVLAEFGDTAR